MKTRPDIGGMVKHKISGLRAQIRLHYRDKIDYVAVIVLPQPGVSGDNRYQDWCVREINKIKS